MTRKLITTLLCLVLAMALPLAALADTRHTLTIIPGEEMTSDPAVADLFKALSLTFTKGEKSGGLTVSLDGEDIATIALGADSTGLYVHSTLLSDDVLYLTWDDGFAYLAGMLRSQIEASGDQVNEDVLEMLENMLDLYKSQIVAMFSAAAPATFPSLSGQFQSSMNDPELIMSYVEQIFEDDPQMVHFYEDLLAKVSVEEGDFTDPERDTATCHSSMTLTGEDLAGFCDTQYMRSIIEMNVKAQYPDLEGEELSEVVDQILVQLRDIYTDSGLNLVYNQYTADEGNTLVGMDMGLTMTAETTAETQRVAFNFNYDRLTGNSGINHCADLTMAVNDEQQSLVSFQLKQGKDGVSDGSLALLASGRQVTLVYHAENQGSDRVRTLNIYNRGNAVAIIEPAASERPLIGFQLISGLAEDSVLEDIEDADGDSAVNVMELSIEELQSLLTDIQVRCAKACFAALASMPDSLMQTIIRDASFLYESLTQGITMQQ